MIGIRSSMLGGFEGVIAGAIGGGLLGEILGTRILEEHKKKYEEMLKAGNHLVIAQGSSEELSKVFNILKNTNEVELNLHIEPK